MPDSSATLGELIDDVTATLLGYTQQQEVSTYLTAAVDDNDVVLPVASVDGGGKGQVEIGDELIYVDRASGTNLTVPPYGRGYRSTPATSHVVGSKVTFRPLFPRSRVRTEINNTIAMISDEVYGIGSATLTYEGPQTGYDLSDADGFTDLDDLLSVSWNIEDGNNSWMPVRRYRFDQFADTTVFPSGKALFLFDPIRPGADVRVVFKKTAKPFTTDWRTFTLEYLRETYPEYAATDDDTLLVFLAAAIPEQLLETQQLTTATNLDAVCRDLITLGAVAALAWGVDLSKASAVSPSADSLDETRQMGSSSTMARQLFQKFQLRLEAERSRLNSQVPFIVRYER
jgi:hypothetical protein